MTIKYRPHELYDTESRKVIYGIQAKKGSGKWMFTFENKEPLFYEKKEVRDEKLRKLKAQKVS